MRRAHDVALEFLAQDPRVATLHARRHRLADERERLMAIQSAEFHMPFVEKETVGSKARVAKADTRFVLIDDSSAVKQLDADVVQLWLIEVPQFDCAEVGQCQVVS